MFKRVIAKGDYVVLHCHQEWPTDKDRDWGCPKKSGTLEYDVLGVRRPKPVAAVPSAAHFIAISFP